MTQSYFPFNSEMVGGVPDRPGNAESLAAYLAAFFANGILSQKTDSLKVSITSGMKLSVAPGACVIGGRVYQCDEAINLSLSAADSSMNRIDRVVVRLDLDRRLMELAVLKGTPAASPAAVELTRDAAVYELCLAEIEVQHGASKLTDDNVTDTRFNADLCGRSDIPKHIQGIEYGGTGATTVAGARNALGLGNTAGYLPVANGGTGNNVGLAGWPNGIVRLLPSLKEMSTVRVTPGAMFADENDGDINFGALPVECGGTGANNKEDALKNLGAVSADDGLKDFVVDLSELNWKQKMVDGEPATMITYNNSRFIRGLNLVIIDLRLKLEAIPYAKDTFHDLVWVPDEIKPKHLIALTAINNSVNNERIYQACLGVNGEISMHLSYAITAKSYVSIQGAYVLDSDI